MTPSNPDNANPQGSLHAVVGHRELEPSAAEARGWWEEWEEREDDDGPHYRCTLCHDTGRVDLDDGHYQYLGDGTGMCPRCCGGVVVHDAPERSGAQEPNKKVSDAPDSAAPNRKQKL